MTQSIWTFIVEHQKEVISFGLTLLASLVLFVFRARLKIIWGRANNNFFRLEPAAPPTNAKPAAPSSNAKTGAATVSGNSQTPASQPQPITLYSEKHYIQNVSRVSAKDVDVIFSGKPDSISIWQSRQFLETRVPNGNYILTIPSMAPHELVIIDSLWITPNHGQVEGVRCAEAQGKRVDFQVQRNFGNLFNAAAAVLFVLGGYYALVLVLKLVIG